MEESSSVRAVLVPASVSISIVTQPTVAQRKGKVGRFKGNDAVLISLM